MFLPKTIPLSGFANFRLKNIFEDFLNILQGVTIGLENQFQIIWPLQLIALKVSYNV